MCSKAYAVPSFLRDVSRWKMKGEKCGMGNNMLNAGLSAEAEKNLYGNSSQNMLWSCTYDPRFCYYVHIPLQTDDRPFRVIVYIHGTGGFYPTAVREALGKFAEDHHCCVLVPLFPSGIAEADDFNSYKLLRIGNIHYDDILFRMLEEVKERYREVEISKIILYGHSGGGQFANRFFYLNPDRLAAVSVSAPGRPTFLDQTRPFYWGTADWETVFGRKIDREALRSVPVQLLVGEKDTDYIGDAFCGSMRVDRMNYLYRNFKENGIEAVFSVLKGIAHGDGEPERTDTFLRWLKTVDYLR